MSQLSNWEVETQVPLVTSCKQAARLVSLSFERSLTFREFLTMSIHLAMCKTCSFYKRQIGALRKIFVRHEELLENTPPSESERLTPLEKDKLKRTLSRSIRENGASRQI
jgi:hypothetical protein